MNVPHVVASSSSSTGSSSSSSLCSARLNDLFLYFVLRITEDYMYVYKRWIHYTADAVPVL